MRTGGGSGTGLINAVVADVVNFVGAAKAADDITMLALHRLTKTGK
jgi:hypothetical protein